MRLRQGPRASARLIEERIAIGIPEDLARLSMAEMVRGTRLSENQINTKLKALRRSRERVTEDES